MTSNHDAEDRFSDLYNGTLPRDEAAALRAELEASATDHDAYVRFERAADALASLRLAPTSDGHVEAVLEAVVPARRRSPWTIWTHAAALVIGIGFMWGTRGCIDGEAEVTERIVRVEVPVEVPVEVVREVEVLVEVPVEVTVEVPVEVPVEVIEYVDRPVPAEPSVDTERAFAVLTHLGAGLHDLARARRAATRAADRARITGSGPNGAGPIGPSDRTTAQDALANLDLGRARIVRPTSPLRIQLDGDRVRIHTRGSLDQVVPALIDTLNDPDERVARAVEQHLEDLRSELIGDPSIAPLSRVAARAPEDRPGGLRGWLATEPEIETPPDPHARWSAWWTHHESSLAVADAF